jgi:hypothetical protein
VAFADDRAHSAAPGGLCVDRCPWRVGTRCRHVAACPSGSNNIGLMLDCRAQRRKSRADCRKASRLYLASSHLITSHRRSRWGARAEKLRTRASLILQAFCSLSSIVHEVPSTLLVPCHVRRHVGTCHAVPAVEQPRLGSLAALPVLHKRSGSRPLAYSKDQRRQPAHPGRFECREGSKGLYSAHGICASILLDWQRCRTTIASKGLSRTS